MSEAEYIILDELPEEHALRWQFKLGDLPGIQCGNNKSGIWRDCQTWAIKTAVFNELGEAWRKTSRFRCRAANGTEYGLRMLAYRNTDFARINSGEAQ